MAESKLTQKDTINNAVVSHSLFSDFYENSVNNIGQVEFLANSGLQMGELDRALLLICDKIVEINGMNENFWEKMKEEIRGQQEVPTNVGKESQSTETIEDTKRGVTSSVGTISHSINRLKMLFNLSGTDLSTKGELEAFCDATGTILNADIEMLEDAVKGLNWFLETDGKGGVA